MDALRARWDASVDRQVARKHGSMKIGCWAADGVTNARSSSHWNGNIRCAQGVVDCGAV